MSEYPIYKKAVDIEGTPIALLVVAASDKTYVIEHSKAQKRTSFRTVADVRDAVVGGQIFDVSAEEYEDILFDNWKLDAPQEVLNAKICVGNQANDTATPEAPTPTPEQPVDPAPESGSEAPANPEPADAGEPDGDGQSGDTATEGESSTEAQPEATGEAGESGEDVPA